MTKLIAGLFVATLALSGTARAATDPKAEALFAEAAKHHAQAEKDREQAVDFAEKAGGAEQAANAQDFEAHVLVMRALAIEKADSKKIQAAQLRHEARMEWQQARIHWIRAHNDRHAEAVNKHDAAELTKAAGLLKDQPAVAAGLNADAKRHTDAAARDEKAAQANAAEAKKFDDKAHALWAKAEQLDPETSKKIGAKPAVAPPLKAPPAPAPSAAATGAGK